MIIKNLGQITKIQKGTSITKDKIIEGNIPVIAGGQNPAYFCDKYNRNGPIITVSASGAYAGFVNFFDYPIFASDCTTIEPININELDIAYLFLFLKSKQQEIYKLQRGAGQPHVYGSDLQNLEILLPPLAEQQAIAHKLDQIQHLISLKQQAIAATDQLAKSIFLEMFGDPMTNEKGWETKTINDLISKNTVLSNSHNLTTQKPSASTGFSINSPLIGQLNGYRGNYHIYLSTILCLHINQPFSIKSFRS